MIRDVIQIGSDNRADHRAASFDADGKTAAAECVIGICKPVGCRSVSILLKNQAERRELRSMSFTELNFLSIHFWFSRFVPSGQCWNRMQPLFILMDTAIVMLCF